MDVIDHDLGVAGITKRLQVSTFFHAPENEPCFPVAWASKETRLDVHKALNHATYLALSTCLFMHLSKLCPTLPSRRRVGHTRGGGGGGGAWDIIPFSEK